jgi:L,D-transpeptidase YcbB
LPLERVVKIALILALLSASPFGIASALYPLDGRALVNEETLVESVYAAGDGLLWFQHGELSAQAHELLRVVNAAESFGLRSRDYGAAQISAAFLEGPNLEQRRIDTWLTRSAARLISHLHYGRIDPRAAGFELSDARHDLDVAATVIALAKSNGVAQSIQGVEPRFYHYALLKAALDRYRRLALQPSLTTLPPIGNRALRPSDAYAGAPQLRRLLAAEGDLATVQGADIDNDPRIDPPISASLTRYQARHGLAPNGTLDRATWGALTTPMDFRVRQIELTLERWRWLPLFSSPPIIVNIPQFELFAFNTTADRAASILQIPVIVGQVYPGKRTPVFVGDMKRVIFRPYWDVPRSIVLHEILPELRRHPDYLQRNHMQLVRGESDEGAIVAPSPSALNELAAGRLRLRQEPGEDNALGLIKFLFPNAHNVYLHSTPAHQLFKASRRAFSHGCIRVADPVALAAFVLKNAQDPWDVERIEAAMQGSATLRVELAEPIRVMVLYGTVMATEAGPIQFFDDIYGHDQRLASLLGP